MVPKVGFEPTRTVRTTVLSSGSFVPKVIRQTDVRAGTWRSRGGSAMIVVRAPNVMDVAVNHSHRRRVV